MVKKCEEYVKPELVVVELDRESALMLTTSKEEGEFSEEDDDDLA